MCSKASCDPCGVKSDGAERSCFRRCWFPVLLDLTLEAYRSRLLVLCSSVTFLLAMLSGLLIDVQPCAVGLLSVDKAYVQEHFPDVERWGDVADVLRWVAPIFALIAASRWHSAWWSIPALLVGGAYLVLLTAVDARFCWQLLPYGSTPVTQFDGSSDGIAGAGQVIANVTGNGTSTGGFDGDVVTASMMATVRLFDWLAALVAAALLLHLLWAHVIKPSMRAGRPFTLSQELAAAAGIAHGPCGPLGPGLNSDCFCFGECCDDSCGERATVHNRYVKTDRALLLPGDGSGAAAASYHSIGAAPPWSKAGTGSGAHLSILGHTASGDAPTATSAGGVPEALLPPMSPSDVDAAAAEAMGGAGASSTPQGKGAVVLVPAHGHARSDGAARSARYAGVARPGRPLPQLLRSYLLYRWHCARLRLRLRLPDALLGSSDATVRAAASATPALAAAAATGRAASAPPVADAAVSGISLHIRADRSEAAGSALTTRLLAAEAGSTAAADPSAATISAKHAAAAPEDPLSGIDLGCCGLLSDATAALDALLGLVPLRQWLAVAAGVCAMTTLQLWLASLLGDASAALTNATGGGSDSGSGSGAASILNSIQDAVRTLLGAGSAAQTCVFIAGVGTMAVSIYLVALDTTTLLEYHRHRWDSRWAEKRKAEQRKAQFGGRATVASLASAADDVDAGVPETATAITAAALGASKRTGSALPASKSAAASKANAVSHAPACSSGAACASCCGRWTAWCGRTLVNLIGLGPVTVDLLKERGQRGSAATSAGGRRGKDGKAHSHGADSDCGDDCPECDDENGTASDTGAHKAVRRRAGDAAASGQGTPLSSSSSSSSSSSVSGLQSDAFVLDVASFAFIDAFTFILSYLTTLLAISALLGIVLTALIFVLTFAPLRSWLLTFVLTLVLSALYRAAVKALFACCVADGRRIFSPRLFAALDIGLSFTTSLLIGTTQGIVRVLLAVVWALLSTSQLARPVLPASLGLARLDSGFAAYGGMHKARLAWLPQPEPEDDHDDDDVDGPDAGKVEAGSRVVGGSGSVGSGSSKTATAADAGYRHSPACRHGSREWEEHADALLQAGPASKCTSGRTALATAAASLGLVAHAQRLPQPALAVPVAAVPSSSTGSVQSVANATLLPAAVSTAGRRFSVTEGVALPRRGAECSSNVLERLNLV